MFGRAKAVRRACDSTCDVNLFERKGRQVTPHVMQISLGAYVVTLAKRPSPQMAQNFHSRYEDFSCLGVQMRRGACVIPFVMQIGLSAKVGTTKFDGTKLSYQV